MYLVEIEVLTHQVLILLCVYVHIYILLNSNQMYHQLNIDPEN